MWCMDVLFVHGTTGNEFYTLSLHDALPIWWCSPTSCSPTSPARFARAPSTSRSVIPIFSTVRPMACASLKKSGSPNVMRSEEHTSELQSHHDLVCRLLLEKKKKILQGTTGT